MVCNASPFGSGLDVSEKSAYSISKTQLKKRIREIGEYTKKENYSRGCWYGYKLSAVYLHVFVFISVPSLIFGKN